MIDRTYFVLEFVGDDYARLCASEFIDAEGSPTDEEAPFLVEREHVYVKQDGYFVKEEKIDGEVRFRQCAAPE
jgi:hypothetical protein